MKRALAAVVAIGLIAAMFFAYGRRTEPGRGRAAQPGGHPGMKRVLAAVVAIGLIAAGFFVNGRRTDPERGRAPLVLWCVTDAAEACNAVASDRVLVTIRTPKQIEADVVNESEGNVVDAVVTSPEWLARLDDRQRLAVSAPLASAPIVVVTRATQAAGCVSASCLVEGDRKVALPDHQSLAAALVLAQGLGSGTGDDLSTKQLEYVQRGGTPTPGIEALNALLTVRLVDAVVALAPAAKDVNGAKTTQLSPPLTLALDIGTIREDPRVDALTEDLRNTFRSLGWSSRSTSAPALPGPDATATIDAYGILNP